MSAVALPAVGGPQGWRAVDHVAAATRLPDATAGDVIHHPVPDGASTATGTDCDHLTARLVPSDHIPMGLRSTAWVLPIDGADIAAADREGLHLQRHLTMSRLWEIISTCLTGPSLGRTTPLIVAMTFLLIVGGCYRSI